MAKIKHSQIDLEDVPLTGISTAPTAAIGTNTTQLATTAFVKALVNLAVNVRIIPDGDFLIFKVAPNELNELQVGDIGTGNLTDGNFVPFGKYLGGNAQDVNNWICNPLTF